MSANPPGARLCLLLISLLSYPALLAAGPLSLSEAERLALDNDPAATRYQALAAASEHAAQAAGSLPNPMLIGEAMNLPLDDGMRLDRTPMTQLSIGLRQTFPRGDTRELSTAREQTRAQVQRARADDAGRRALLGVRQSYLELQYQRNALLVLTEYRGLFRDLLEITEREFAAGRVSRQAVLAVELELERLEDRITAVRTAEAAARSMLARWIGTDAAGRPLAEDFPDLPVPPAGEIGDHPLIRAEQSLVEDGRQGIELARQGYRPQWGVQLNYGRAPGARDVGGVDRLSGMVTLDMPLFSHQRPDNEVLANLHQRDAALQALRERTREMEARLATVRERRQRLNERETRHRERLMASARRNAEAAEQAYRAGTLAFPELIRARIDEAQTRLDALRVFTEHRLTQAELLYLLGEPQ